MTAPPADLVGGEVIRDLPINAIDEADAKLMWCPEVRRLYCDEDGSGAAINRRGEHKLTDIAHCIGAACMFWRFVDRQYDFGFCGKAGQP